MPSRWPLQIPHRSRAFPGKVDTGFPKGNATNIESRALPGYSRSDALIYAIGKRSRRSVVQSKQVQHDVERQTKTHRQLSRHGGSRFRDRDHETARTAAEEIRRSERQGDGLAAPRS